MLKNTVVLIQYKITSISLFVLFPLQSLKNNNELPVNFYPVKDLIWHICTCRELSHELLVTLWEI